MPRRRENLQFVETVSFWKSKDKTTFVPQERKPTVEERRQAERIETSKADETEVTEGLQKYILFFIVFRNVLNECAKYVFVFFLKEIM